MLLSTGCFPVVMTLLCVSYHAAIHWVFSCCHDTAMCFLSCCYPLGVFLLSAHCYVFPIILLSIRCFPVVRTLLYVSYHTAIHWVFSCCQHTTCFLSYCYPLGVFLLSAHYNMFPIILLSTVCFPVVSTLQYVSYHTAIHCVFSCCQHTTICFLSYCYPLGVFLLSAHYNMFPIILLSTGCFPVVSTLQYVSYHTAIHWVFSCCQHTTCFLSYCYPLGVFLLSAHYYVFPIILLSTGCFPVVSTLQYVSYHTAIHCVFSCCQHTTICFLSYCYPLCVFLLSAHYNMFPIILLSTGCFPVVSTLQYFSYHTAIHCVFSCCHDTAMCFLSCCYPLGVFLLSAHYYVFPIILLSTGCFPVVRTLLCVSYHTAFHWVFSCCQHTTMCFLSYCYPLGVFLLSAHYYVFPIILLSTGCFPVVSALQHVYYHAGIHWLFSCCQHTTTCFLSYCYPLGVILLSAHYNMFPIILLSTGCFPVVSTLQYVSYHTAIHCVFSCCQHTTICFLSYCYPLCVFLLSAHYNMFPIILLSTGCFPVVSTLQYFSYHTAIHCVFSCCHDTAMCFLSCCYPLGVFLLSAHYYVFPIILLSTGCFPVVRTLLCVSYHTAFHWVFSCCQHTTMCFLSYCYPLGVFLLSAHYYVFPIILLSTGCFPVVSALQHVYYHAGIHWLFSCCQHTTTCFLSYCYPLGVILLSAHYNMFPIILLSTGCFPVVRTLLYVSYHTAIHWVFSCCQHTTTCYLSYCYPLGVFLLSAHYNMFTIMLVSTGCFPVVSTLQHVSYHTAIHWVFSCCQHTTICFLSYCYPLGVFLLSDTTMCFLSYCYPLGVFLLSAHYNMFPIILLSTGCFPVVSTLQYVSYHTAIHWVFSCCQDTTMLCFLSYCYPLGVFLLSDTTMCFLSYCYPLGVFLLSGHYYVFPIILLSTGSFPVVMTLLCVSYHTAIHWVFSCCQDTTMCLLSYCYPLGVFLFSGHYYVFPIILLSTGCFPVVSTLQYVSYHTAIHWVFSCCQDTTICFLSYCYPLGVFLFSGHYYMFPIILLSTGSFPVVMTLLCVSYHTAIHWMFSCCQDTTICFLSYCYPLGVFLLSAHYNMFPIILLSTGCFPVVRTLLCVSYHTAIHWVFSCCQHTTICFLSYCYPLGVFLLSGHYYMFPIILLSTGSFPVVMTLLCVSYHTAIHWVFSCCQDTTICFLSCCYPVFSCCQDTAVFPIILLFTGCFPVVMTLLCVSYHAAIHWVFSCCQHTTICFLSYCYPLGVFLLSGHYNIFPIILLSTGCFPVVSTLLCVSYHTAIHWVFSCCHDTAMCFLSYCYPLGVFLLSAHYYVFPIMLLSTVCFPVVRTLLCFLSYCYSLGVFLLS